MYYTDDSILPENMAPLIITAAPFGPEWLPGDADIPVTWDEQAQAAVDCYNAGATMPHVHVRDPATGHGSVDFDQFNYFIGRLKEAVPKMILQVGGSISFSPKTPDAKAKWLDYDTRHMLTELDPKPECVTVATGTTQWDVISMFTPDDAKDTHLDNNPKVQAAWAGMWVDAGPAFYLEHLKRLRKNRIQPYFVPGHVHQLEIIERLIRAGVYMGPLNLAIAGYGGGTLGRNPFDWMEMVRRVPQGSVATFWSSMRGLISLSAMAIVLGQHVRVGNEDNLWGPDKKRRTTVQQIEGAVRIRKLLDPYKTPAWVTLALIPHLPELIGKIWEPASGSGKMVAALRQAGFDVWWQATSLRAWTSWVGRRRRVSARSSPIHPMLWRGSSSNAPCTLALLA